MLEQSILSSGTFDFARYSNSQCAFFCKKVKSVKTQLPDNSNFSIKELFPILLPYVTA